MSIGNDSKLESNVHWYVELDLTVDGLKLWFKLNQVMHVPSIKYQILSVSSMCELEAQVVFDKHKIVFTKDPLLSQNDSALKDCTLYELKRNR